MHDRHARRARTLGGWLTPLVIFAASSVAAGPASAGNAAFVVETLDTSVDGGASDGKTDLVVAGNGRPRVTYIGSPRNVRAAIRTDTEWFVSPVEGNTSSEWPSIALDDADVLHFTYQSNFSGGPGDDRFVYRRTVAGSPETIAGSEGSPGGEGNDLVVHEETRHAAFRNDSSFDYGFSSGTGWAIETILANAFDVSLDDGVSIDVAPDGTPQVAWTPSSCADGAQIARRIGADNWLIETIPGSGCVDGHVGLDTDAAARTHVAFRNADTDAVVHAERPLSGDAGDWIFTPVDARAGAGRQLDLEVAAGGGVHVVYTDAAGSLWYAVRQPGGTAFARRLVSSGQSAERPSVGVDAGGRPWVAFTADAVDSPGNNDLYVARIPVRSVDAQPGGPGFEWRIATDDDVTQITGFFRRGGEPDYRALPSLTQNGALWTAPIAPADYGPRGLEVYLNVTTTTGDGAVETVLGSSDEPVQVRLDVIGVPAPSLPLGAYRLVSAPMLIDGRQNTNQILQSVYGPSSPTTWRMGRWDPATLAYRNVDVGNVAGFAHGASYWLGVAIPRALTFSGTSVLPAPTDPYFRAPLEPGWTMAGNPAAYRVTLDPGQLLVEEPDGSRSTFADAATGGRVSGTFFGHSGGAYVANPATLDVWDGLWVLNTTSPAVDLTLLLPASDVAAQRREPAAPRVPAAGWTLALRAEAGTGAATAEIGIDERASTGADHLDAPAPPAPPEAPVRMTLVPEGSGRPLYRDMRPPGTAPFRLRLESEREALTLTFDEPAGTTGEAIVVHDDAAGWTRTLRTPASLVLPAGVHALDLTVSADAPPPARGRLLLRAAPNPARRTATVTYELPSTADVRLDVFDVSGRRVARRSLGRVTAGTHVVDLRALAGGDALPSGVYVARLDARFASGGRESSSARLVIAR